MKILIQNGRVMDPASGRDELADIAIAAGRIIAIGKVAPDFHPNRTIDATGCVVAPGLVDMLKFRAEKLHQSRVFPLGALTRGLKGEVLTEMAELTESGCIGFGQAEVPIVNAQVLQRALQYAATFCYTVWLRPQDFWLGKGVAASGPLATRMGLAGVPAAAETIALHILFELLRGVHGAAKASGEKGVHVHLCRISSAAGLDLVRQAK